MPDDHQHYVPQFILRNFGTGNRNKQIWVFDKQDGRSFRTAIRNIASEGGFYDFSEVGERRSLDPAMQKLEDAVVEDFRRINQQRAIPTDMEARVRIAFFAAVQNVRTEAYRQQYKQLGEHLRQEIEKRGGWAPGVEGFPVFSDEETDSQAIRLIPELARSAVPHFMNKSWILYTTTSQDPFWIGDHPVTLENTLNESEVMGTLGLGVRGIEISLPLSDTLCLGFLCPSNEALVRESLTVAERTGQSVDAARRLICAFEGKEPFQFSHENVMRHNSLQVAYAEKYVFSRIDEFSVARQMTTAFPSTRSGPRFDVG